MARAFTDLGMEHSLAGRSETDRWGTHRRGTRPMKPFALASLAAAAIAGLGATMAGDTGTPRYDGASRLIAPPDYREWVFLSSGIDMSYSPSPAMAGAHMFDNVFAPRAAYARFKRAGVWADKTVLMLEVRGGASKGSINKRGQFQTGEVMGLEAHVKDTKRFTGGWAFFGLDDGQPGK